MIGFSSYARSLILADNNGKMALFSAEGGIFDTLRGLYSQFANIDIFLFGHSGDTMFVDRKGRPRETLEKPCLTVLLFIQPKVLSNDVFKGRGLTARFLYTYPVSAVGKRRYKTEPIPQAVEQAYHKVCDDLLSISQKEMRMLTLSHEADVLSENFFNALEPRLGKDGDLEHMADWAGKHHGAVLRIAGLLHVVEGVSKNGVQEKSFFGKTKTTINFDGTAEEVMTVLKAAQQSDKNRLNATKFKGEREPTKSVMPPLKLKG